MTGCHGRSGEGDNQKVFPRLQGQHYLYMKRQARLVRDRLREVEPGMAKLLMTLPERDLDLVLNYVSHLEVPADDLAPEVNWRNPDYQ